MPPRPLSTFEAPFAASVIAKGTAGSVEYAAYLETPVGPLLELVTEGLDDRAGPTQITIAFTDAGGRAVLHHNHLSQESLSFADWNGASVMFDEVFAHCADGTVYWGRVIDAQKVADFVNRAIAIETEAENCLFSILLPLDEPGPMERATFFRKEVANRAMALTGAVEYAYAWGTANVAPYHRVHELPGPGPAGQLGAELDARLDQAARALAPRL
jgi:hypothetical protein